MNEQIRVRFSLLFSGLTTAYDQYSNGRAKSVLKDLEPLQFKNHFLGKMGLGIVPIMDDGESCQFGVIDIDDTSVDHDWLVTRVTELGYPITVCRSKSGGAHLYTFTDKPIKAAELRRILSKFASKLGYGSSEIFPKQDSIKVGEVGNWINLPYFDIDKTLRYGVDKNGRMSIEEFLNAAELVKEKGDLHSFAQDLEPEGMPPCLVSLYRNGVDEGNRNEVMYSFAVFFKKSGVNIEESLLRINYKALNKPLSLKEVQTIAGSVKRKDYQYKCKDPTIKLLCDAVACRRLKFGVGGARFEDYDEQMIGCLTKHMTDPPRWVLDINGVDIEFSSDDLMNYYRVRILSMERANIIAPPLKQEEWLLILKERMEHVRIEEAPTDASMYGDLISAIADFVQVADRSQNGRKDLFRGLPVKEVDYKNPQTGEATPVIFFRSNDFIGHLKRRKSPVNITGSALWMAMRKVGCQHTKIKAGENAVQVWYVHMDEDLKTPILEPISNLMEI
jgi:hypothetical protein